ncbi:hypothetical protein EMCLV003L [Equine molluscum contagiosum-like virus]|nr:hypothetical protein EMCLV003L [Equine molluscum contagiosum-like virus]
MGRRWLAAFAAAATLSACLGITLTPTPLLQPTTQHHSHHHHSGQRNHSKHHAPSWNESAHIVYLGQTLEICLPVDVVPWTLDLLLWAFVPKPTGSWEEYLDGLHAFGGLELPFAPQLESPAYVPQSELFARAREQIRQPMDTRNSGNTLLWVYEHGNKTYSQVNSACTYAGLQRRITVTQPNCIMVTAMTVDDSGYYTSVLRWKNGTNVTHVILIAVTTPAPDVELSVLVQHITPWMCTVSVTCTVTGLGRAGYLYLGDFHDGITVSTSEQHYFGSVMRLIHRDVSSRHRPIGLSATLAVEVEYEDIYMYDDEFLTYHCYVTTDGVTVNSTVLLTYPCLDAWIGLDTRPVPGTKPGKTAKPGEPEEANESSSTATPTTASSVATTSGPEHAYDHSLLIVLVLVAIVTICLLMVTAYVLGWWQKFWTCVADTWARAVAVLTHERLLDEEFEAE